MNNGFPGDIGKALVILGGVLLVVGLLLMLGSKYSWLGLGHLPGDIRYKGKHTSLYFPLATCVFLSAVFTLILWLISHFRRP
jgi:peptidoglycan biosynthesis protein MviN/MurJ (putative lipid II flippase)